MTESKKHRPGGLMERLFQGATQIDRAKAVETEPGGWNFHSQPFSLEQLGWLEDYPEYWVDLFALPAGTDFTPQAHSSRIQVREISAFLKQHEGENVWRSWMIYRQPHATSKFERTIIGPVPFWLDIDDEQENLARALQITHLCVKLLAANPAWAGSLERVRVGFSGRKGFHIYARPCVPLDGQEVKDQLAEQVREQTGAGPAGFFLSNQIGSTVLDRFHDEVRVMGSVHSWHDSSGGLIARRTFVLPSAEFLLLSLEEILARSAIERE